MAGEEKEAVDTGAGGDMVTVEVNVDWSTEPAPLFSDFATVIGRPTDMGIAFCAISPENPPRQNEKDQVRARVVSSIRMSAQTYLQLLSAMVDTWNKVSSKKLALVPVRQKPKEAPDGN